MQIFRIEYYYIILKIYYLILGFSVFSNTFAITLDKMG